MFWQDLREEEFEDAITRSKGVCILPIGCLEKHGQHMAVGTDYYIAVSIARRVAELEEAVIFPTGPWLGDMTGSHGAAHPELVKKRGNVAIKSQTLIRVLEELCDEIAKNGFTKIVIFNVHGGNIPMVGTLLREIQRKEKPYTVYDPYCLLADDYMHQPEPFTKMITENREEYSMITDTDIAVMKSWIPTGYQGGHANFLEAVQLMGDYPQLVAPDRYYAENGINTHRTDYLAELGINMQGSYTACYPNSYSGAAPHGASQTIGQAMLYTHAKIAARQLKRIKEQEI